MRLLQIVPDQNTFVAVLKATGHTGDVQVAYEAIQEMKANELPMTIKIYDGLIRTYAGACKAAGTTEKQIDAYINDAWMLLAQLEEKNMKVNINILNGLILLHGNALREADVEGKVLPLFEKYKIAYDTATYTNLMRIFVYDY